MIQQEFRYGDPRRKVGPSKRLPAKKADVLQVSGITLVGLGGFFEASVRVSAFRGLVGRQMECPVCHGILDCRSATGVDVYAAPRAALLASKIFCDRCFEAEISSRVPAALLVARKTHPRAVAEIERGKWYYERGLL